MIVSLLIRGATVSLLVYLYSYCRWKIKFVKQYLIVSLTYVRGIPCF